MAKSGWYKESARHSLAAKGVPTGRRGNYILATTDTGKKVFVKPIQVGLTKNELNLLQEYLFSLERTVTDEGYFPDSLGYEGKTRESVQKLNEALTGDGDIDTITKDDLKRIRKYVFTLEGTVTDEGYFPDTLGYKGKTEEAFMKLNELLQ